MKRLWRLAVMKKLKICSFKVGSSKVESSKVESIGRSEDFKVGSIGRSEDADDNRIMSAKLFEDEDETDDWYK